MSLKIAKNKLEQSILKAFETVIDIAKTSGEEDNSTKIRQQLAKDLTNAIDEYVRSADVDISSIVSSVPAGVPVTTAGTPTTQAGTTTGPGAVTHTGVGHLQ